MSQVYWNSGYASITVLMGNSRQDRGSWAAETVPLPFAIGELQLGAASLRACTYDLHFSLCPDAASIETLLPADEEGPAAIRVVRSCPTPGRLPRLTTVHGKLRYAERHYRRYLIDLDGTYEQYLAHFSPKTRSTLMRKLRRFTEASGGRVDSREYNTAAEVDEFFATALAVAKRTYQYRLFGDVFSGDDEARQDARRLAEEGRFRGYVLRFAGRPIAFLYSPISEGHLLYRHLGYDPEFEAWSPGTVLLLHVLESAFREKPAAKFDFCEGESDYKALFATSSVFCADLYFFPPTLRNRLLVYSHITVRALSRSLVGVVSAVGLKRLLKRAVRRRWVAPQTASRERGHDKSSSPYLSYIADSLRTKGAIRTLATLLRGAWMFFPRPWRRSEIDRATGIETDGLQSLRGLTIDSVNKLAGVHYEPCPVELLRPALQSLPLEFSNYVFVDLGCGKGRPLVIASEFCFARLIGVEFARELHAKAVSNIQHLGLEQRCDVLLMDAADYDFENRPTVLFLFNPFGPKVLSEVIAKIVTLTAPVVVVYGVPRHGSLFSNFSLISQDNDGDLAVYANQPAAEAILKRG